jgi:PHD/YefM family antitoxin component YafN of YafNO toxin-antitoxin module
VKYYTYEEKMKRLSKQFLVDESGKKKAVVLSLEEYEELLEDLHDLAIIAERKDEPTVSFDEIKKRLKADGLI